MAVRGQVPVRLVVAILTLATVGCASTHRQTRVAPFTTYAQREAGFSPQDVQRIEQHCPFGMPRTDPGWQHGPTQIVVRDGYVLQHSSVDKVAFWVCEEVVWDQLVGDAVRRNRFLADPKLPAGQRAELEDYRGSGYDRGHQAPAGNQSRDQRLKDETFYLSNMAPQLGAFNQRAWAALEDLARTWVFDRRVRRAQIITGGMFYDPDEDDPTKADGTIPYVTIGDNQVAVPTHFYKIIAAEFPDGQWRAIGFVMENRSHPAPYRFTTFVRSIDWIEERTGLDFMPDLDLAEEERLERQPTPMWFE
jgi:endonuclease G